MTYDRRAAARVAVVVLGGALVAPWPARASDHPLPAPYADCASVVDEQGDATPVGVTAGSVQAGSQTSQSDHDILSVALGTVQGELVVHARFADLAAAPSAHGQQVRVRLRKPGNATDYLLWANFLTDAGKQAADQYNAAGDAVRPHLGAHSASWEYIRPVGAKPLPAGVEPPAMRAVRDAAKDTVTFAVRLATLAPMVGIPVGDGTRLSLAVDSLAVVGTNRFVLDSVGGTSDVSGTSLSYAYTYLVGDSACFLPAETALDQTSATRAQHGDRVTARARLVDADGDPVAGKVVTFGLGAVTETARTDDSGVAVAQLVATVPAGTHAVSMRFAGDDRLAAATAGVPVPVAVERTSLRLTTRRSGTRSTVTALLRDDDGAPVAKAPLVWYVSGRRAGSGTTSASGAASFVTKAGVTVKAVHVGTAGRYAAASATVRA